MKKHENAFRMIAALFVVALSPLSMRAQQTVRVHVVVTAESTNDEISPADFDRKAILVKQGKDRLQVSDWIPARGDQAALQLFILIDDTCASSLGTHLDDLRAFIKAQPATTSIAIGYMRNAGVNIVRDFTPDHEQAASALRLPLASTSSQDSPYLSLISLLKRWPESKLRREVLMVSDGIDRLRNNSPMASSNRGLGRTAFPSTRSMPYISPDVSSASNASQRYGVTIHSIYAPGVGRADRNYYEAQNGLNGLAKLSDETGGEAFYLTAQSAVSFKPYTDRLQTILENQYFLVFLANPQKNAGLQQIRLDSEYSKVEFVAADNVWVPARSNEAAKK
jgi:hypothetical protein